MSRLLEGQRAVITGAGRGIGLAIARAFAAEGAAVAIVDIDDRNAAAAAAELQAAGADAMHVCADLGVSGDVDRAAELVLAQMGGVDTLVNNAFTDILRHPEGTLDEEWERSGNVNVRAGWQLAKLFRPALAASPNASVINLSSVHAVSTRPGFFPYNVTKAAILGLTRALAVEWGRDGIRVNALMPGYIWSVRTDEHLASLGDRQRVYGRIIRNTPLARYGEPEDVAPVAVFLASPMARFVTGAAIPVDGGLLAMALDPQDDPDAH